MQGNELCSNILLVTCSFYCFLDIIWIKAYTEPDILREEESKPQKIYIGILEDLVDLSIYRKSSSQQF